MLRELNRFGLEATPEQRLGNVENVGGAVIHPEYVDLTGKMVGLTRKMALTREHMQTSLGNNAFQQ